MSRRARKELPAVSLRNERLQRLLERIKNGKKLELSKILAEFCFETGLSIRKANEYINILSNVGKIKVTEEVNEHFERKVYVEYVGG